MKQCCAPDGVEPQYIKDEILPHFFKHFWNHRVALDRRNYRQVNRYISSTPQMEGAVGDFYQLESRLRTSQIFYFVCP